MMFEQGSLTGATVLDKLLTILFSLVYQYALWPQPVILVTNNNQKMNLQACWRRLHHLCDPQLYG